MDPCLGGHEVQDQNRGEILGAKSGADQSQGDGWGGIQDTRADGENPENS